MRLEDQERLVRVGPGTPAGRLFRRYWLPAMLSEELTERDGPPVKLRLLGEDLIGFRDSDGRVGLVDAFCPHRRGPLFLGRNEECGLRCAYHGWKFDVTGICVDLPSEQPGSLMKNDVRLKAYPTVERGGVVWAYLGPEAQRPPAPDYEWTRAPATHRAVSKNYQANNYLQSLEGGLDTTHVSYLHNNRMDDKANLFRRDGAPKIEVEETEYGYRYLGIRNVGGGKSFVRLYHYVMPCQGMRPNVTPTGLGNRYRVPRYDGHIWVPIDDTSTWVYNWICGFDKNAVLDPDLVEELEAGYGRGRDDFVPGTYRLKANASNDYFIDRQLQKTTSFTGISGINTQDMAVQEGMGPIVDRTKEYLGTSDRAIIVLRRILLDAIAAVERGDDPRGADPASYRNVRPHDGLLPSGSEWRERFTAEGAARW